MEFSCRPLSLSALPHFTCKLASASYTAFLYEMMCLYFRVLQQPPAPSLGIFPQEMGCQSVRCPQDFSRYGVHTGSSRSCELRYKLKTPIHNLHTPLSPTPPSLTVSFKTRGEIAEEESAGCFGAQCLTHID